MSTRVVADQIETFVGFWPAGFDYGEIAEFELENGLTSTKTASNLKETILSYSGEGWKMLVCADYLCLMHLDKFEGGLAIERQEREPFSENFLRETRAAWPAYVQALNAWNFLLIAACNTGRSHYVLTDFEEVSVQNCVRLLYGANGTPLRQATYGRRHEAVLRRFRERLFTSPPTYIKIHNGIFNDAAHYWGVVSKLNLVQLANLGGKLVSEHRLKNYRPAVALAWFEIEAWIIESIISLGFSTRTRKSKERRISEMINDFPDGSSIANMRRDLQALLVVRNDVAHKHKEATYADSALALRCFLQMVNVRTGLALGIDANPAPIFGL